MGLREIESTKFLNFGQKVRYPHLNPRRLSYNCNTTYQKLALFDIPDDRCSLSVGHVVQIGSPYQGGYRRNYRWRCIAIGNKFISDPIFDSIDYLLCNEFKRTRNNYFQASVVQIVADLKNRKAICAIRRWHWHIWMWCLKCLSVCNSARLSQHDLRKRKVLTKFTPRIPLATFHVWRAMGG